jgi:hypothetical protein
VAQVQDQGQGAPIDVASIIAQSQAAVGGGQTKDRPLIPLWQVRPAAARRVEASAALADRMMVARDAPNLGSSAAAERAFQDQPVKPTIPDPVTTSVAESHWADMTEAERMQFAEQAQKAGMWKPSQGGFALFTTWSKAVELAQAYNENKGSDEWLSPFEAVSKMSIKGLADENQVHDGFSTQKVVQQFSEQQLRSSAQQVLQSELGRNPTASEMRAYVAAINRAARNNPQTVLQHTHDDGLGHTSSSQVQSGGINPEAIIQDMVPDNERDHFNAAATYFPAAMAALNAIA